jgi:hypothetical protein
MRISRQLANPRPGCRRARRPRWSPSAPLRGGAHRLHRSGTMLSRPWRGHQGGHRPRSVRFLSLLFPSVSVMSGLDMHYNGGVMVQLELITVPHPCEAVVWVSHLGDSALRIRQLVWWGSIGIFFTFSTLNSSVSKASYTRLSDGFKTLETIQITESSVYRLWNAQFSYQIEKN